MTVFGQGMKIAEHLKWFHHHGTAPLLALALLMICLAVTRRTAHSPNPPAATLIENSHRLRQAVTIRFLDRHEWVTGLYFYFFIALMIYLAWRRLPDWVTSCTFAVLAAPWLMYLIRAASLAAQRME